jgi:hypothetical protein
MNASNKVKWLVCCCCGVYTLGRQWWNRDTGFGCCVDCWRKHYGSAEYDRGIGERGKHFAIKIPITAYRAGLNPRQVSKEVSA